MKKIPTLFKREFEGHNVVRTLNEVSPGFEWVLAGEGEATVKFDGSCCAVINGDLYKRYDAKHGKNPPSGAIACCAPDPVTGHWPHWVKCSLENPCDKWFWKAFETICNPGETLPDGTYEAIGAHFQGNPYHLGCDFLTPHGIVRADLPGRSFDAIKFWLNHNAAEGIVFWKDGQPQCKIKRSDFGMQWPILTIRDPTIYKLTPSAVRLLTGRHSDVLPSSPI